MGLKTVVKVGCITNLSDARYCAGMGVDMLGFRVHPDEPAYVPPEKFHELRGWFSGPKVVAEIYGVSSPEHLEQILKDYQPDMLELSLTELDLALSGELPLIVRISAEEFRNNLDRLKGLGTIRYLLISSGNETFVNEASQRFKVLLSSPDIEVQKLLSMPIAGIALNGSPEEKPGYKTYEQLAAVLEELEQD